MSGRFGSFLGVGFLVVSTAASCGGSGAGLPDGDACDSGDDCHSSACQNGTCVGSLCECVGADCRGQSSCDAGWLCTRYALESAPRCRKQCTGAGTCPPGFHCDSAVCVTGGEVFGIEWVTFPRTTKCVAGTACPYKVRPSAGAVVAKYTWTFGSVTPKVTTEPETTFLYTAGGNYAVSVVAQTADGTTAKLTGTETICIASGEGCDPAGAPCCTGTCGPTNVCN